MRLLRILPLLSILLIPGADKDKLRAFRQAWQAAGTDAEMQAQAIFSLHGEDSEGAAKILTKILEAREIPFPVEEAVIEVMGKLRSEKAVKRLAREVHSHPRWQARVIIARALKESASDAALAGLLQGLSHPRWPVRSAIVGALAAIRSKDSIDPLIARLAKEDGRVSGEIQWALRKITGMDLAHLEEWESWWGDAKATFKVPPLEKSSPRPASGSGDTVTKTIYGEVISKNVIFVVDISDSMKVVLTKGPDRGLSRLQIVKRELCRTILWALPEGAEFNIIAYGTDIIPWKRKLVESTQKDRDAACAWVERLDLSGDTNIMGALDAALDMGGRDIRLSLAKGGSNPIPIEEFLRLNLPAEHRRHAAKLIRDGKVSISGQVATADRKVTPGAKVVVRLPPSQTTSASGRGFNARGPDTIYFLSDGTPSVGRITLGTDILGEVRRTNGTRNVVIHTIALLGGDGKKYRLVESKPQARDFLQKLAGQNGGTYKVFE